MTLFVSNLSFRVEDDDLLGFFEEFGEVISANVVIDKTTQKSRGFGFVEMKDADALKAMQELNGATADGRVLRITEAKSAKERRNNAGKPFLQH